MFHKISHYPCIPQNVNAKVATLISVPLFNVRHTDLAQFKLLFTHCHLSP